MEVRLHMRVERDTEGRLSGEVTQAGTATSHGFSGMLEMLKILEDLVLPGESGEASPGRIGSPGI